MNISNCPTGQPRHRAKATEQMVIRPNGRKLSPPESHFRGPFELKIVLLSPTNSSKILAKSGKHLVPKSVQKTNKMEYNILKIHGLGDTTQSHKAKPNW